MINDVKDSYVGCQEKNSDDYAAQIREAQNEVIGSYSFLWLFSWIGTFATFITITKTATGGKLLGEMSSGYNLGFAIT
ncbi:MAG: hypothetical protein ACW98D_00925 [Promethearchaeota archaeon]